MASDSEELAARLKRIADLSIRLGTMHGASAEALELADRIKRETDAGLLVPKHSTEKQ
jgi:hypothetical protein